MANAIFLAFDESYSLYARACLNSIKANYPKHPTILVYYDGANPKTLDMLSRFGNLKLMDEESIVTIGSDFNLGEVNSRGVYFKYSAWSKYFDNYDNVLYLDVDTLVLKPLDDLLSRQTFFAVPNHEPLAEARIFGRDAHCDILLRDVLAEDGLPLLEGMDDMLNAGVFVLPKSCRSKEQFLQLIAITKRYNKFLKYADQSAISLWCHKNRIAYSQQFQFNFQTALFGCTDLEHFKLNDINILHFSSSRKPNTVEFMVWKRIPLALRKELAKIFVEYARESGESA